MTTVHEQTSPFAPQHGSEQLDDGRDRAQSATDFDPASNDYRPADDSIFRVSDDTGNLHLIDDEAEAETTAEQRKLAAERAARREAREAALAAPDAGVAPVPEPVVLTKRTTDGFLGSVSLFLLRLVVAAIMAVRGLEIVTNLPAAEAKFATTIIPEPKIMALVTGVAALAIAVALVFGLLTRLAGLGVTLITAGALVFVLWGNWSPFVTGQSGFIGELELLLAGVGLVFLCIGAGGFSLDRSFRKSREKDRLADQAE
ncbi:DoxX family protein [Micropruina sonneratiae]|uniref:DoxX family protein n=1 Tax=Micropruina sonneratiae TaxID=2986940 RepID=UPI0022268FAD|nr:DoxX family protein [Micropruina sp. KQZ13P-5]MCW3156490.1 DoxX family protein [Micropruina sp. KQZ13P-5]